MHLEKGFLVILIVKRCLLKQLKIINWFRNVITLWHIIPMVGNIEYSESFSCARQDVSVQDRRLIDKAEDMFQCL